MKVLEQLLVSLLLFASASAVGYEMEDRVEELFNRAAAGGVQFLEGVKPAQEELIELGAAAVPYLIPKLGTKDARERHALEDVLKEIKGPAVEPLVEHLNTDDERALRLTCRILGLIGDRRALSPLSQLVSHRDWMVRSAASFALGKVGAAESAPALLVALRDSVEMVRTSAAVALGRVGHPGAIAPLIRALNDDYYGVRYSAATSLVEAGTAAVKPLLKAARDEDEVQRHLAIEALGMIGDRKAVGLLRSFLWDEDWATRGFAAEALGSIGGSAARRALRRRGSQEDHPFVLLKIDEALEENR